MTSPLQLSITPVRPSELPQEAAIVEAGRQTIDGLSSWKQGKTFQNGTVQTRSRAKQAGDGAPWHARISTHAQSEVSFDALWERLGNVDTKAEHEKNFVHDIKKATLVKRISPTQAIWTLYYTFPPPVSPRVFTVLHTSHFTAEPHRTGTFISIPIDLSGPDDTALAALEEKGVRGLYCSVERVTEQADGTVKWEMVTSSTPGGNIPAFVSERTIPGKISEDVPSLLKYLHTHPTKPTATEDPAPTATSAGAAPAPTIT